MRRTKPVNTSRRRFLLGGLAATGVLVVGWGLLPARQRLRTSQPLPVRNGAIALNGWVAIRPDGIVDISMPRSEMGQGVHTALPMLLAEELDVALADTRLVQAPIDKIFGNVALMRDTLPFHPDSRGNVKDGVQWVLGKVAREMGIMFTGGSSSIRDAWEPMREAGAVARAMLVAAAASEWKVPPAECSTEAGFVTHPNGHRAGYGSLVAKAATVDIDVEDVRLKNPNDFRLIGRDVARRDSPAKVNGVARYGTDVRPEGMVYAAVKMAPVIGATVKSFDAAAVKGMPGVLGVVDFSHALRGQTGAGRGVAVIARSWWQARQAALALPVAWDESAATGISSDSIYRELAAKLDSDAGFTFHDVGDMDAGEQAALTVTAQYRAPFLAHATMEPINCTAQVSGTKVSVWASTQVPSLAVEAAARVAGVSQGDVTLEVPLLGGGFGRRLETDMVAQAVAVAMQADGAPVQLIWSREDDIAHDVYRPAALARFTATLDAKGKLLTWDNKSASASINHQYYPRSLGLPGIGPDKTAAEGEYDMQYEIANQRIRHVTVQSDVPVGFWRSVGHSHNAFFKESFIEEVAHAAGRDAVELRRSLLANHPRDRAVLDAAVGRAGRAPVGRAHGVALHHCFGSTVAQVAEVSVEGGQIRVHRVVCAIDCGLAINPNIIRQQMESAVVFGLSAALGEEATIKDGRVQQSNFHDYPVLRMAQAPQVDTVIMPSAQPPQGVGEPGVPPIAPAVAAAVFRLTGQRLRSLPLRLS